VQSDLSIDPSIAGACAAATRSAKSSKRASQSQRLAETRRRQIANGRAEVNVVEKILEVDRDVQIVALLGWSGSAAALWSTGANGRDPCAAASGRSCTTRTTWTTR